MMEADLAGRDGDIVSNDFEALFDSFSQLAAVGGIDMIRRPEAVGIHALDKIKHHNPMPQSGEPLELFDML